MKIDKSFIKDIATSRQLRAIVRMIVELSKTLAMPAVAEGVEDAAQAEALDRCGCHALQDYLFAKPMPPDEIAWFLRAFLGRPEVSGSRVASTDLLPLHSE